MKDMSQVWPQVEKVRRKPDPILSNVVLHWGFFSREELEDNPGSLLMMDVDFGRACSLRCPSCFRRRNKVDDSGQPDLIYEERLAVIDQARQLGLRSAKICGAGEPTEEPSLLRFAEDLTARGIGLAVFTKGHILGDDEAVTRIFGLRSGKELCRRFFDLKVSFLVSFQSARPAIQDTSVGKVRGFTLKRNRAIEYLAEAGFNKTIPTRLAVCANPLSKAIGIQEPYEIYCWARQRNILPVIAALMVSGKQFDSAFLARVDVSQAEKLTLYRKIYRYNLDHGYSTPEQLRLEGISCLPGIHPCNQIAAGLYLTRNGSVTRCPGDNRILGNVRVESLAEIWQTYGKDYQGQFNVGCPFKDGVTLPTDIYNIEEILRGS